jgi:hypothetical protein
VKQLFFTVVDTFESWFNSLRKQENILVNLQNKVVIFVVVVVVVVVVIAIIAVHSAVCYIIITSFSFERLEFLLRSVKDPVSTVGSEAALYGL